MSESKSFTIHFKNHDMITGTTTTSRTQTHRITAASECLNWVVNTFQLNDRETQKQVVNTLISPQAAGEMGKLEFIKLNLIHNLHHHDQEHLIILFISYVMKAKLKHLL